MKGFIMNGMRMIKPVLRRSVVAAVFIGVMTIQCCAFIETRRLIKQETTPRNDEWATLEKANKAFQKNNYNEAMGCYEHLRHAGDELIRRRALYGLACTRLILSENADEYNDALILWNSWTRLVPVGMKNEDPRMVDPLLQGLAPQMIFRQKSEKDASSKKKLIFSELSRSGQKEIQYLKDRIKTIETENVVLKRQKEMMAKEIRILQDQIASFEAIDQKMQEKKKDISSP